MLPFVQKDEATAPKTARAANWWFHVGDHIYYTPPALLGLSQDISNYWYARGSASALSQELKSRRVGGTDRWHIFHFPRAGEGASLLQSSAMLSKPGDRRSSISALMQLKRGQVLAADFAEYAVDANYSNGLSDDMSMAEKNGISGITSADVENYLRGLVNLGSRSNTNDTARESAEMYLKRKFADLNGESNTCLQPFDRYGVKHMNNVITYIPGKAQDNGFVVVGAHFDSRPFAGDAPGANDNGSGVAAMLAILEAVTKTGVTPQKPIYFVGFAAEEVGCWGSESFVEALKSGSGKGLTRVGCGSSPVSRSFLSTSWRHKDTSDFAKSAAIIMDEVGWVSTNLDSETVNLETYDPTPQRDTKPILDHLASAAEDYQTKLTVVHSNNPFGSDHMSFLTENLPAVLLINGDDEAYPNYHTSNDKMSSVNTGYVAKIATAAFGGLFRMANSA